MDGRGGKSTTEDEMEGGNDGNVDVMQSGNDEDKDEDDEEDAALSQSPTTRSPARFGQMHNRMIGGLTRNGSDDEHKETKE